MGFRTGAYATVWKVEPLSQTMTKLQISTSRKDKDTGGYVQDFQGFVVCLGTIAAQEAAKLQRKDRIKLGDCDVTTSFDKKKNIGYTNFKLFSFERMGGQNQAGAPMGNQQQTNDYRYANQANQANYNPLPYEMNEYPPEENGLPF